MVEQGFSSFDLLAKKLIKRKPRLHGLPPERSLAVYLGKLDKGYDGWWRSRELVAAALAELLGMSPDELLPPKLEGRKPWPFEEFRQLPALDLEREDPCDLFERRPRGSSSFAPWLPMDSGLWYMAYDIAYHRGPMNRCAPLWISAPPGAGKRLLARWAEAKGWVSCLEVSRLSEAVGAVQLRQDGANTVVLVSEADPEADLAALQSLAKLGRIAVLAPFQFPLRDQSEGLPQRRRGDPEHEEAHHGWTLKPWRMAEDWRERFLDWVDERLNGQFDKAALLKWLFQNDRLERIFSTPGDLLPLCALINAHGPRWLHKQTPDQLSTRLLENLTERVPNEQDGRLWLSASAADFLQKLLAGRMRDLSVALRGGSPATTWAGYYPSSLLPSRLSELEVKTELKKLGRLKSAEKRHAEDALALRMTTPHSLEAIALLNRAGVLRTDRSGGLAVYPRWTQEACLRKAAAHAVKEEVPTEWGRLVVEGTRRQLIDDTLDSLTVGELLALVRAALSSMNPRLLGSVGAIESLFATVGRRLGSTWRPTDRADLAVLHELWLHADSQRVDRARHPTSFRVPSTRIDDYWQNVEDFVASCWAFSFCIPAPQKLPADDPPWLWPGWSKPALNDLNSMQIGNPEPFWANSRRQRETGADRLLRWLEEFLRRCNDTEIPAKVPSFAVLHVIVYAAEQGWKMDVHDLWWQRWQSLILSAGAHELTPEVRRRIADWLIDERMPDPRVGGLLGQTFKSLREGDSPLFNFILENADWERVRGQLAKYTPQNLLISLADLPEPLQDSVIEQLATRSDAQLRDIMHFLMHDTGAPPRPLRDRLLIALADAHEDPEYDLPQLLYEIDRERALQTAERAWRRDAQSQVTLRWFLQAPELISVREPLIALIRETPPSQRPAWARGFLLSMLHYAAERTDEIFQLAQGYA